MPDERIATHSAVLPWAGGRLHGPDDAQVEPREVAVGRRAIASVGLLTAGSPRKEYKKAAPATMRRSLALFRTRGEYSRELSAKMSRAHRQQAQLGFRQGRGRLIYGFRRLLVDPARNPRQILNTGERKAISSDKVVVVPGPPEQLAVIRRIFGLYVRHQLPVTEIVERLAKAGIKDSGYKPLGVSTVRNILSN